MEYRDYREKSSRGIKKVIIIANYVWRKIIYAEIGKKK